MRSDNTATAELIGCRGRSTRFLSSWGNALFELCDAVLCPPAPGRFRPVPDAEFATSVRRYGNVTVRSRHDLHPKLYGRGK